MVIKPWAEGPLEVLKHGAAGPLLIAVKETRLAIGHGITQKIMVSLYTQT